MYKIVPLLAYLLVLLGCDSATNKPLDHLEVRFSNETPYDLDSTSVLFSALDENAHELGPDQNIRTGPLKRGETTPYHALAGGVTYTSSFVFAFDDQGGFFFNPLRRPDGTWTTLSLRSGRYLYRIRAEEYDTLAVWAQGSRPDAPSDKVEIRVKNTGTYSLGSVVLLFPAGANISFDHRVDYGSLAAGAASDYVTVPYSYRYTPATVSSGQNSYCPLFYDWVGEDLLPPGRYTFGLGIEEATRLRDHTVIVREGA